MSSEELAEVVTRLAAQIAAGGVEWQRAAVRLTGGLPVYGDMGGVMVLMRDGTIVSFAHDRDEVEVETDELWRKVAFVHAARRFPELAALRPVRPADAADCAQCAGTGAFPGIDGVDCGPCAGSGWI